MIKECNGTKDHSEIRQPPHNAPVETRMEAAMTGSSSRSRRGRRELHHCCGEAVRPSSSPTQLRPSPAWTLHGGPGDHGAMSVT